MPLRIKIITGLVVAGLLLMGILAAYTAVVFSGIPRVVAVTFLCVEVLGVLVFLELYVPQVTVWTRSLWRGRDSSGKIALTFDDGPSERVTETILSVLRQHGARATFFVLGRNVVSNESLLRRMKEEGHEIGNHGFSHEKIHLWSGRRIEEEIRRTEELIERSTGIRPHLLRTPHGFVSPVVAKVARRLGYDIVAWSRGVWDTEEGVTPDVIVERSLRGLRGGEILLLHDAVGDSPGRLQDATAEALPSILAGIRAMNLEAVPVGELLYGKCKR